MFKKLALLLGATAILVSGVCFMPGVRYLASDRAYGLVLSVNSVDMHFSDNHNRNYMPVSDTAAILILNPPVITMVKDVRNLRTGETSPNVVTAIRGDTVEFILTIANSGDTDALNVVESDSIPLGTVYFVGSALDTGSLDPLDPPDTITFQHVSGGEYDFDDTGTVIAIKWQWDKIEGISGNNIRTLKFKVRIPR